MTELYPYLVPAYEHFVRIAKLYDIDLKSANEKEKDHMMYGNKFGAQPNDINLDIAGAIHDFIYDNKNPYIKSVSLREYVIAQLFNWGYESDEITKAIVKIPKLNQEAFKK